jgi:hypothetical protein
MSTERQLCVIVKHNLINKKKKMKESCCGSNQRPVSDVQLRRLASISLARVFSKLMQWYTKLTSLCVNSHDVKKTTMCFLCI